jgi:hypothetical protein
VRHRRIDVVPRSIIRASHKPDPVIVAEEDNVALVIATKYHPFVAWTMPDLVLGEFGTMLGKCRPSGFGNGESLSGPSMFGYTPGDRTSRRIRHLGACSAFPPDRRWP